MLESKALHLHKVSLRTETVASFGKKRGLWARDFDEGYLVHCVLRQLWQAAAPAPFVVKSHGRLLEVWGYSSSTSGALLDHMRSFSDPELAETVEGVSSKEMPAFEVGRRLGFLLRACPVVRLSKGRSEHRAGAEIDAFLARCFAVGPEVRVSREEVYRDWLSARLSKPEETGCRLERTALAAVGRERFSRRTQGSERKAHRIDRPDVRYEGDLVVTDSGRFAAWLAHGVGRHRAFGFGAVILVPPGTSYDR